MRRLEAPLIFKRYFIHDFVYFVFFSERKTFSEIEAAISLRGKYNKTRSNLLSKQALTVFPQLQMYNCFMHTFCRSLTLSLQLFSLWIHRTTALLHFWIKWVWTMQHSLKWCVKNRTVSVSKLAKIIKKLCRAIIIEKSLWKLVDLGGEGVGNSSPYLFLKKS